MKKTILKISAMLVLCLCMVTLIIACNKKEDVDYTPKNIVYDGVRITWDKVEDAEYYNVAINDGEAKRVNTTMYSYENTDSAEFDVTVTTVVDGDEYSSSMHFIPLDTIQSISVSEDGALSWEDVVGAGAYRISVNGTVLETDLTEPYYEPAEGSNRIKIRAVVPGDNSYYSLWSEEKQVYINAAPTSVKYDGETLSWVGNSLNYDVTINGIKETVSGTTMVYASDNKDFTVEIKALGDQISSFNSKVTTEEFHYLAPATNLMVGDGILHWDAVENAEGYNIRVNGVVQKDAVTEAAYDKLTAGNSLEIEVRPYNNSGNYFSVWSVAKNVYILETPVVSWNADLELDGEANNNFVWNVVNGAAGYVVELEKDGNVSRTEYPSAQTAFAYAYAEVGKYNVRVKATAEAGSDFYDSKYSTDISVERLAAPKASGSNYITSNATNLKEGFTVSYLSVAGASGYQLYKDGVLLSGKYSTGLSITDSNVADETISAHQEYNYAVRSMGGVKTVSGKTTVTLPCLTEDALSFKITVQAMPTDLTMSGFMAGWTGVAGSNGYIVKFDGTTVNAAGTTHDMSSLKAGSHDISVCAKGNGTTTLASNYTAPITVERLSVPTNITISYGEGEGQIGFDNVANAKSYQIFLDESNQALPESAFSNMYQYIRETGTVLHMVAVGNYFNELGNIYYMTSEASPTQQFIRLAAPTIPEGAFSNSAEFVWNAPDNINTSQYTPTYELWIDDVMWTGGEQNGTKMNIAGIDAGSHTFKVKAVGNNSTYLDSEFSVDVTITKLATPKLEMRDGKYYWGNVANASSYVLEIDGKRVDDAIHVSGTENYFAPNFTTIGNHIVNLYAVGDGGKNTIDSAPTNYTQVVKACMPPEITFAYSEEAVTNGGSIVVTITTPSENCTKYLYEIAGESIESSELTYSKQMSSTGSYVVRVKALGGTFDEENIYYIDSQFAGGGTITLLAYPTVGTFSINSDGAVKWATISGASGYDYQISYDGGAYSDIMHTGTPTLDPIADFKSYKTIKIKVRASGNGVTSVSSEWIEWTWTNPN